MWNDHIKIKYPFTSFFTVDQNPRLPHCVQYMSTECVTNVKYGNLTFPNG